MKALTLFALLTAGAAMAGQYREDMPEVYDGSTWSDTGNLRDAVIWGSFNDTEEPVCDGAACDPQ